jgi:hypothetical protein
MNMKVPRQGGDSFVSSPIINSPLGDGNIVVGNEVHWYGKVDSAPLGELRELIALLRVEVEAAGDGDPAENDINYELRTIEQELTKNEPDGKAINSRWQQVLRLLEPLQHIANVATVATSVTQITAAILALFGN